MLMKSDFKLHPYILLFKEYKTKVIINKKAIFKKT